MEPLIKKIFTTETWSKRPS